MSNEDTIDSKRSALLRLDRMGAGRPAHPLCFTYQTLLEWLRENDEGFDEHFGDHFEEGERDE